MENKLDNLFRDKLSSHKKDPSDRAWDQLHHQLSANRRSLWIRRLSIAASVLLVATIGFVGYRSLNNLKLEHSDNLTNSTNSEGMTEMRKVIEGSEEKALSNEISDVIIVDDTKVEANNEKIANLDGADKKKVTAKVEDKPATKPKPDFQPETSTDDLFLAESNVEQEEPVIDLLNEEEKPSYDHEAINHEQHDLLASESIDEDNQLSDKIIDKKPKTYPEVRIVYKANQNSELVTSGKRSILDKGINKITEFSDEHLLTAERKTKLRNTKEDLLALNFGKLLNKSDRDLEN